MLRLHLQPGNCFPAEVKMEDDTSNPDFQNYTLLPGVLCVPFLNARCHKVRRKTLSGSGCFGEPADFWAENFFSDFFGKVELFHFKAV